MFIPDALQLLPAQPQRQQLLTPSSPSRSPLAAPAPDCSPVEASAPLSTRGRPTVAAAERHRGYLVATTSSSSGTTSFTICRQATDQECL